MKKTRSCPTESHWNESLPRFPRHSNFLEKNGGADGNLTLRFSNPLIHNEKRN